MEQLLFGAAGRFTWSVFIFSFVGCIMYVVPYKLNIEIHERKTAGLSWHNSYIALLWLNPRWAFIFDTIPVASSSLTQSPWRHYLWNNPRGVIIFDTIPVASLSLTPSPWRLHLWPKTIPAGAFFSLIMPSCTCIVIFCHHGKETTPIPCLPQISSCTAWTFLLLFVNTYAFFNLSYDVWPIYRTVG